MPEWHSASFECMCFIGGQTRSALKPNNYFLWIKSKRAKMSKFKFTSWTLEMAAIVRQLRMECCLRLGDSNELLLACDCERRGTTSNFKTQNIVRWTRIWHFMSWFIRSSLDAARSIHSFYIIVIMTLSGLCIYVCDCAIAIHDLMLYDGYT